MLDVSGVAKNYGDVAALSGIDLTVAAGSVVSLLGRNGAGKSTLLSTIAGLLRPDSGTIRIDGVDRWQHPVSVAPLVGIAGQETGIYRSVTVRDNLGFFAELAGLRRRVRDRRVADIAALLNLSELLGRKASHLSGGEARRLHTACALVHEPKVLLLDEPTVGADVATRNDLIGVVRAIAERGAAVLYTTHYLPEVEALASDIVIIDRGRVLARGTQRELVDRYRTEGVEVEFAGPLTSPPIFDAERLSPTRWRIPQATTVADGLAAVASIPTPVVAAEFIRPTLERVFLNVTGHALDSADPDSAGDATAIGGAS